MQRERVLMVTMARISTLPDLDLTVVGGAAGLGHEVRWVHVSEMLDPTPWLQGGELLLTTGMGGADGRDYSAYVHRLADAGLAGIGFGVGRDYGEVPEEMIAAANERGMPLLRIPQETPYMAISEAVSSIFAEDRYDAIARAVDAQQRLIQAALGSGSDLVREISRQLDGWAIQTDRTGGALYVYPESAGDELEALAADLIRMRGADARQSASIVTAERSTLIQPLAAGATALGHLIVGFDRAAGTFERLILTASVSLATLEAERARTVSSRLHRFRSSTLIQLLKGPKPSAETIDEVLGWGISDSSVRVCVLLAPEGGVPAMVDRVIAMFAADEISGAAAKLQANEEVAIVMYTDDDGSIADELAAMAADIPDTFLGVGESAPIDQVQRTYQGALHAASIGRTEHKTVTRIADLAAMRLILNSGSMSGLTLFIEQVLGPLRRVDLERKNAAIRTSLELFLAHNGHWSQASDALQLHRHTLRAHMRKVHELTGRNPDEAYARMELWLAILLDNSAK